jgi:chitin disaccharide deacetylase
MHLLNAKNKQFSNLNEQLGFTRKDILVIVNIDDVGMHKDETEASFRAFDFGIVKSGSVMVPCPNFDNVRKYWENKSEIDLGIHLTLTCEWGEKYPWSPVLSESRVPSLYNKNGAMWPNVSELLKHASRSQIYLELNAQIIKMFDAGFRPTHLDHHMDFYYDAYLFEVVMNLSKQYNLPMRVWRRRRYKYPFIKNNLISLRRLGYVFPDTQMGLYMAGRKNPSLDTIRAKYYEHLRSLKPGLHNIKVHMSFWTEELEKIIGKHDACIRQIDYDVWACEETKNIGNELGITFIGFRPLQKLQGELLNSSIRHVCSNCY